MAAISTTRGHAGEILQQNARGHEGNLLRFRAADAARDGVDVGGLHLAAIFVTQQVFEQDAVRERQARNVGNALFLQRGEAENAVVRARHIAAWTQRQNCSDSWVDFTISNGLRRSAGKV